MGTTLLQPGEIEASRRGIPFLRLPGRKSVFLDRAQRLRRLAQGHSMGGFLELMARTAFAQQAALDALPAVAGPAPGWPALARRHRLPPLGVQGLRRDPAWHEALKTILLLTRQHATPEAREAIERLEKIQVPDLERMAQALLEGEFTAVDPAAGPFVAAALQVYWVALTTRIGAEALNRIDPPNLCPVCGSHPVASVVRIGGDEQGLRYLCCSLCAAQWHWVRIKCSHCESTEGVAYHGIEGGSEAVKVETCDQCKTYLKILYMEKDNGIEPVADDLASLALDMLVVQAGYNRIGPNLMFIPDTLSQ